MKKKVGLVVIYDPHNVYQFLWYYSTYGKNMDWYALCLPNSYKGEYLSGVCEKLGIFKKVYRDTNPFDSLPLSKKFSIFIKMFFYALVGKQKKFSEKFIASYVEQLNFDTAVVLTDVGFLSGLFLTMGKKKEIVILEDGMGDYLERKYSNIFSHFKNFFDVQGFILSVLGYNNIGHYFPLRTTKNCIKYCSHPEKMAYTKYKAMNKLFDMEQTDEKLFKSLLSLMYPKVNEYFDKKYDAILFSTPLSDVVSKPEMYNKKVEDFIKAKCKSVLLKRHPRDKYNYNFGATVSVIEINQQIPAEVLLPYIKGLEIYFCEFSSTTLYMSSFDYNPKFFYFQGLREDNSLESNILSKYKTKEEFQKQLEFFGFNVNLIEI